MANAVVAEQIKVQGQAAAGPLSSTERREIKPLTSLRFIAALVVLFYHGNESFKCWSPWGGNLLAAQAVGFFFVLSGFILTYIYGRGLPTAESKVRFYQARVARIWPAHLGTLFLLLFLIPEVFKVTSHDWPLFLSNLFLVHALYPVWHVFFSYNASAWSISTEICFYLAYPFLLTCLNKKWYLPLTITGTIVTGLILFCNYMQFPEFNPNGISSQGIIYVHPLARIFDFSLGMTLAVFWRERWANLNLGKWKATFLEVLALTAMCLMNVYSPSLRYAVEHWVGPAGGYWMQNCGPSLITFAFLVGVFAISKGYVSKFLSLPLMVHLGELSFGIYLLHGIFLTFLGINFPQQQSVAASVIFMFVLFYAAHLMHELLEKPMRSFVLSLGRPKSDKGKQPLKHWLAVGAQAAVFAGVVYCCLPTINRIDDVQAKQVSKQASLQNIELAPYLKCASANAQVSGDKVALNMVFEALKDEPVNFSIQAIVLDGNEKAIGRLAYTQDGRVQRVSKGDKWLDQEALEYSAGSKPKSVAICVVRNKRSTLHQAGKHPGDYSFVVPVNGTVY